MHRQRSQTFVAPQDDHHARFDRPNKKEISKSIIQDITQSAAPLYVYE